MGTSPIGIVMSRIRIVVLPPAASEVAALQRASGSDSRAVGSHFRTGWEVTSGRLELTSRWSEVTSGPAKLTSERREMTSGRLLDELA